MLNQHKKQYFDWVDGARLLAILSVILQHVPQPCLWNAPLLTSSLALFFILAGYFASAHFSIEENGLKWGYVRHRVLTFLRPYIIWNLLFTAGDISMRLRDPSWSRGSLDNPLCLMLECLGLGYAPAMIPLWFLRDLIIFMILSAILLPRSKPVFALLTIGCFFLASAPDAEAWPKPYMFGNFGLGIMLGWIPSLAQRWGGLPIRFHWGVAILFIGFSSFVYTMGGGFIYEPITPLGVLALLSGGAVIAASCLGKWLPVLGKSIFFIYCFHTVVIIALMAIQSETGNFPPWLWWSLVPFIAGLCFGVYRLISRHIPGFMKWISC